MKYAINNKLVLKKLTKRTMKANKVRNIFVVTAISLTAFLLTTIFSIGMSTIDSFKMQQLRVMGTTAHAALTYPSDAQINKLHKLDYIKSVGLQENVADIIESAEMGNMNLSLHWYDSKEWELFRKPAVTDIVGKYPQKYNEIMVATWILEKMGITKPQIGMELELNYSITKNSRIQNTGTQKFILSGYYKDYTNLRSDNAGVMLVSKGFKDRAGLKVNSSGAASVIFNSADDINLQANNLSKDIEVSTDQKLKIVPLYDSSNTNDTATLIGMAAIILIILLSGYLLIYNVLSLSVSKDIRYYGLLKTIGTTPVQLGRIVIAQALRLALIGIPIGLMLGAVVSYIVVPLELSVSNLKTGAVISYNPLIFIGAAVFTILTTMIASLKPAGKVRRISPVEAIRYTGLTVKRNVSKSSRGGRIQRMAVKNIFRDRKKALLVLASLFLGMTTFLVINTLVLSMNVDNLVADYIKTDFKLTNNAFKVNASEIKQVFDKSFISKLNSINGVKNIREISSQDVSVEFSDKFYGQYLQYLNQKYKIPVLTEGMVSKNPDIFWACLIGLDTDYIRELNKKMEKPIDIEAFESGKIALYNIDKPEFFQLGSNITFTDRESRCKYSIRLGGFISDDDSYGGVEGLAPNIYISNNRMRQLYKDPAVYAITLDAEEGYKEKVLLQLEELLGSSIEISLDSKQQMLEKFSKDKLIMFILGGGMALILAFIGIMNFINIMVTSVNARRQEFAVMESIGMSRLQLNRMLLFEGGAYAAITCTLVLTFGNCISYLLFRLFQTEATYAVYTFPFATLFVSFVIIFAVCLTVPGLTYNSISKQSITERLRSIEG